MPRRGRSESLTGPIESGASSHYEEWAEGSL
jgi:hypothetical protein